MDSIGYGQSPGLCGWPGVADLHRLNLRSGICSAVLKWTRIADGLACMSPLARQVGTIALGVMAAVAVGVGYLVGKEDVSRDVMLRDRLLSSDTFHCRLRADACRLLRLCCW